jgi:hypothetical protein
MEAPLEIIEEWFTKLHPSVLCALNFSSMANPTELGLDGEAAFIAWLSPRLPLTPYRHMTRALSACALLDLAMAACVADSRAERVFSDLSAHSAENDRNAERLEASAASWWALRESELSHASILAWSSSYVART